MKIILLTATIIASAQGAGAQLPEPQTMILTGTGIVFECINEHINPYGTCFKVGTERWGVQEDFDRPIGSEINVEFHLYNVQSPDGDTYRVHWVHPIPMGEGDPYYK